MELSVIVVSWNVRLYLERCLSALQKARQGIRSEVIVIDNHSQDGTAEYLAELPKEGLKVILNDENLGFAKAVNQGIRVSQGEFILLLNPDTEVEEGALSTMVAFMRAHTDAGIAGCKIVNADGSLQPSVRMFPDLASQTLVALKLHRLLPGVRWLGRYFARDFDYNKAQEVDQVMGAFFLFRRELVAKIGPFDEGFFLWFEEVDFCRRAKNGGWKIMYTQEAQVRHIGGRSFAQLPPLARQRIFNASMRHYVRKHVGFPAYLALLVINPLSLLIAAAVGVAARKSP